MMMLKAAHPLFVSRVGTAQTAPVTWCLLLAPMRGLGLSSGKVNVFLEHSVVGHSSPKYHSLSVAIGTKHYMQDPD
jgi:hypothetical protein